MTVHCSSKEDLSSIACALSCFESNANGEEMGCRDAWCLQCAQDPSLSLEDRETQLASIGLGLSILSVVSTSQDLAADPILIEHTPLLLKVRGWT